MSGPDWMKPLLTASSYMGWVPTLTQEDLRSTQHLELVSGM